MVGKLFSAFATAVSHATGKPITFALCVLIILVWAISGPIFHFSDTWQLIINTGTTIVTFLQVILIQNTQNRDGAAIQTKLDELIRASAAHNRYIGIEHLTEKELDELRQTCADRAAALESANEYGKMAVTRTNELARQAADLSHTG